MQSITILGIESSCDDTAAAILQDGQILSNVVAGQEAHRLYGGVVPEVASRAHQQHIVPVVHAALQKAGVKKTDLTAVAFTNGPGLIGSLIVGASFAKGLALSLGIPLLAVHHMRAHVLAHFIEDPKPSFPFLCLTVSGGHTQIVVVKSALEMEVIGTTLDDAAGEAFDKTGKLLGLDYPAGPLIDQHAQRGTARFSFPEPKIDGLDFSFSGLKTSILYFLKKELQQDPDFVKSNLPDICASVQDRIVRILINKLRMALELTSIRQIAIAGGVSANSGLRKAVYALGIETGSEVFIPKFEYCTDNAAMIAMAGFLQYQAGIFASQNTVPKARIPLT